MLRCPDLYYLIWDMLQKLDLKFMYSLFNLYVLLFSGRNWRKGSE